MNYARLKREELIKVLKARDKSLVNQTNRHYYMAEENQFLKHRNIFQRIFDVQYKPY